MFGSSEVTNDGKYLIIKVRRSTEKVNLIYYVDLTEDQNKEISGLFEPKKLVSDWIGSFDYE